MRPDGGRFVIGVATCQPRRDEPGTATWRPRPRTGSGCWPSSPTPTTRWTADGQWVGYVIFTDGEAGIDGLPPGEAGPIRVAGHEHRAKLVGVDDVRFLQYPDRVIEPTMALRRDLAREIRRARPEVPLTATYATSTPVTTPRRSAGGSG